MSKSDRQLLTTLFALGREVASVLDLDELYRKLPGLISRVTDFHAMAVYLVDERHGDIRIAYAEGYPHGSTARRLQPGEGLVGRSIAAGRPLLANDVADEPHYIDLVPGTRSELVVPLRRKGQPIGALKLLKESSFLIFIICMFLFSVPACGYYFPLVAPMLSSTVLTLATRSAWVSRMRVVTVKVSPGIGGEK